MTRTLTLAMLAAALLAVAGCNKTVREASAAPPARLGSLLSS